MRLSVLLVLALSACGDMTNYPVANDDIDDDSADIADGNDPTADPTQDDDADGTAPADTTPAPVELPPLGARRCDGLDPMLTSDPTVRGPHPVGVRTLTVTDPLRPDRPLVTEVWYPAAAGSTGPGVSYGFTLEDLTALAGGGLGSLGALLSFGGGDNLFTIVETDAIRDAAMAAPDGNRGVILFSHGFRGIRYQSTFLTDYLASHGYVVVGVDHVGNTLFDGASSADQSVAERIDDVAALTDWLETEVNNTDSFLHGGYDPDRIAWTGHSFGASTAIMAGAMDNRPMLIMPLAPAFDDRMVGVWNQEPYDLRASMVIIGGSADNSTTPENQRIAYDQTVAPKHRIELDGARHFDFTDLCANDLLKMAFNNFVPELADACGPNAGQYHHSIQALATASAHRYLACDPDADQYLEPSYVSSRAQVAQYWSEPGALIGAAEPLAPAWTTAPTAIADTWSHAVRYGDPKAGKPTLVFVGGDAQPELFWPVVDSLASDFPVLLVDADIGSDPAALQDTLTAMDVQKAVLVGWDSGANLALEHVLDHDDGRVAGLALVGAAPLAWQDWLAYPDYAGGWTLPAHNAFAGADHSRMDRLMLAGDNPAHEAHIAGLINGASAPADGSLLPSLATMTLPTLLIHGEQDDISLIESSEYLANELPDATLQLFQRSGHVPFAEEPIAFAASLSSFASGL